jgi:hypothetical protein
VVKDTKANPIDVHRVRANLRRAKELQDMAAELTRLAKELLQEARLHVAKGQKLKKETP